jgi:hypothetical protein
MIDNLTYKVNSIFKINIMKKVLILLILVFSGCKDNEETEFAKEMKQRKEKGERILSYTDAILEMDAEKLTLLSIIKKVPNDTLHLILKDYLNKTGFVINDNTQVDKIIDTISQKYDISKIKIASIVFSYNYEMLTRDEIEQIAIENEKHN